jgi:hypothetical protein
VFPPAAFSLYQQKWHNNHNPQQPNPDEQYKLSYGMDQSALRLARRPMSIEGSFYEDMDGLNGNLTGGYYNSQQRRVTGEGGSPWGDGGDEAYTPEEEAAGRRRGAENGNSELGLDVIKRA